MRGIKSFRFEDNITNHYIPVFYYIPTNYTDKSPIIFVMHGCLRNAEKYIINWINYAEEHNIIVVAPKFQKKYFEQCDYNYGNVNKNGEIVDEDDWTFNIIDKIFEVFIEKLSLRQNKYIIYGHSAGAQFVHRYFILNNSKYMKYAISANAGSYCMLNDKFDYPWGIKNLSNYTNRILSNLGKKLYVLIGDEDNKVKYLPDSKQDYIEGSNRYERGKNFFKEANRFAINNKINMNWKLEVMHGVGHDNDKTIPYCINIINEEED
jgi:hypothetical protein